MIVRHRLGQFAEQINEEENRHDHGYRNIGATYRYKVGRLHCLVRGRFIHCEIAKRLRQVTVCDRRQHVVVLGMRESLFVTKGFNLQLIQMTLEAMNMPVSDPIGLKACARFSLRVAVSG